MLYIETDNQFSDSLSTELEAAGLPRAYGVTTRRTVDGVVIKGQARAFTIDVDESQRAAVQAVLDAHAPNCGHVAAKVAEAKQEAGRRITVRMPEWKQRNYLAYSLEMTRKEQAGDALTVQESATLAFIQGEWAFAKSVRAASDAIESEVSSLTDAEAGVYDVLNNPLWP